MNNFYLVYHEDDKVKANKIRTNLAKWNINSRSIIDNPVGTNTLEQIRKEIQKAKFVLILVSSNYIGFQRLRSIIEEFAGRGITARERKCIPILIENVEIPYELIGINSVNLAGGYDDVENEEYKKLSKLIRKRVPGNLITENRASILIAALTLIATIIMIPGVLEWLGGLLNPKPPKRVETPTQTISPNTRTTPTPTLTATPAPTPTPTPKGVPPLKTANFEVVTVNSRGTIIKRSPGQARFFTEDLGNGVTLEMVEIPGGTFMMGSPTGEKDRDKDEGPQHNVNVPAFFMGKFEVTQEQYQAIIGKNPPELQNPSNSNVKGDKRPVVFVSWNDAVEFCEKLSKMTGRNYRLPSEAEWEYAARAGTNTPFHFGKTITDKLANYNASYTYASESKGEYRDQTTKVGQFQPNAFGLHDMHGNVWEWCLDAWNDNYEGAPTDGSAWIDNNGRRVLRGGSWYRHPTHLRSAARIKLSSVPANSTDYDHLPRIGFRVVYSVTPNSI